MANIISYLTFNGNCREAMTFYKDCLGGELTLQTVDDPPTARRLPVSMKGYILQATLKNKNLILMASDIATDNELKKGNSISLMLNCDSEQDIYNYYTKLSKGGEQTHPVIKTYWGTLIGNLTDKYGNHWMLNCPVKNNNRQ